MSVSEGVRILQLKSAYACLNSELTASSVVPSCLTLVSRLPASFLSVLTDVTTTATRQLLLPLMNDATN